MGSERGTTRTRQGVSREGEKQGIIFIILLISVLTQQGAKNITRVIRFGYFMGP